MMKRRNFIKLLGLSPLLPITSQLAFGESKSSAKVATKIITKKIPSSGEAIPVIGMGTSRTFNVGQSTQFRNIRAQVLETFFEMHGTTIDSSPMYGSSEEVLGYCFEKLGKKKLFSATKVWTSSTDEGKTQFADSLRLWKQSQIDLYQIHNLVNWREHLKVLREYKAAGKICYIGITTSHRRRIDDFAEILKKEPLDFAQFTYNLEERWNESKLLKIAADRGVAVMINRPLERGELFDRVAGKPLPEFAKEIDCTNWAQFFLKWVVSHPSVTCAIPATSQVAHMRENMGALKGRLPDAKMRQEMLKYYEGII